MKQLLYKSTRGNSEYIESSKAIIKGIAEDGGLYVPEYIPKIEFNLKELAEMSYKELAYFIMSKYFTDFTEEELKSCIENAYDNKFDTEEICPLNKVGKTYFLELYHGATLAFKDVALSILPYLLKTALKKQVTKKEILILTATSGDTGKAALEGFRNVEGIKVMVFYPEEGVSMIQKLQMVTHDADNCSVIAVKGNFDDAQSAVKKIFTDNSIKELLEANGYMFSSANSINIGRLVPQIVYYFYAYISLYKNAQINENESINFVVPTGNFGNILAAYFAGCMGLPINRLICASNENRVLYDFLSTGNYDINRKFYTTNSPSMDIIISSNLERLLYFISGENSDKIKELMKSLSKEGEYKISPDMKGKLANFYGEYATDAETCDAIKDLFKQYKEIIDTHTAVAYSVYEKYLDETRDNTKTVIVSTASPYKFPKAVMNAIDKSYDEADEFQLIREMNKLSGKSIPAAIKDIQNRSIIHKTVCSKENIKSTVLNFIKG